MKFGVLEFPISSSRFFEKKRDSLRCGIADFIVPIFRKKAGFDVVSDVCRLKSETRLPVGQV